MFFSTGLVSQDEQINESINPPEEKYLYPNVNSQVIKLSKLFLEGNMAEYNTRIEMFNLILKNDKLRLELLNRSETPLTESELAYLGVELDNGGKSVWNVLIHPSELERVFTTLKDGHILTFSMSHSSNEGPADSLRSFGLAKSASVFGINGF